MIKLLDLFNGLDIKGKLFLVRYKGRVIRGKCLEFKRMLNDSWNITCLTPFGHIKGKLIVNEELSFVNGKILTVYDNYDYERYSHWKKISKREYEQLKNTLRCLKIY